MTRTALLSSVALLAGVTAVMAQPSPFDMTPESNRVIRETPAAPAQGMPQVPVAAAPAAGFGRYLLPDSRLRLTGEEAKQGVVVYLTAAQAAAPAVIEFSYLNALVVAPEISNLRVRINGTEVASAALASSAAPTKVALEIPAEILRAGANVVEFRASQRHRTDCTVESTYELWTEIDSSTAQLRFTGSGLERISQLADLGAVGVDASGNTSLRIIAPDLAQPEAREAALHLAQQIALAIRTPKLTITLSETISSERQPGVLDVAIMPAAELPAELEAARPQASSAPLAALIALPSGNDVLVISGPDWPSITRAGGSLLAAAPVSTERPRFDLPNALPLLNGGDGVSFGALGVDRLEFNGRRYTTNMQFELPSDFYGYRYGELELVLDAAYSRDVLPGSEINIYTNGEIASATPLLRTDGGTLKDTRIRIPMTSLRPGRNEATLAVNLQTRSDAVCNAGWTGAAPVRFAMSANSYFRLPDYARATTVPDLQVLTGSGWPYAGGDVVPLALGQGVDSLVSAMMFAARIASASGGLIDFDVVNETDLQASSNAMIVMPTGAISPLNLPRTGVSSTAMSSAQNNDQALLDQFGTGGAGGPLEGPTQWLLNALGLTLNDLRVLPSADGPYQPTPDAVVVSQVHQPEGGIWTVLTATSGPALIAGTERLVDTTRWREISGRVSALGPGDESVTAVLTNAVSIITPEPLSALNLRRVAANWFSGNVIYFALAIIVGAFALMLVTSRVLARIGRPS